MNALLVLALAAAAWFEFRKPAPQRWRDLGGRRRTAAEAIGGHLGLRIGAYRRVRAEPLSLVVLVQQLAALLRGGRGAARLWEEMWLVHSGLTGDNRRTAYSGAQRAAATLSEASIRVLGAARSSSSVGNSAAEAIRGAVEKAYPSRGNVERRIWVELAACLDIAETSGCPLADILTRFASQLEAEEDAEAARQTALAGPKATVRLLSWLPVLGLGLGMALGVDPLGILLDNVLGMATLATGLVLTVAGRLWSSRLVAAAGGGG
ncbi:type II secretion system F family protein [Paenarthrobacter sp. NPDC092416]|uniref:type II secretion system F family protein n=1 Tax=Paenarthrobacter sp. NPDC092416 TaxID=3364386 RepID=UPI003829175D